MSLVKQEYLKNSSGEIISPITSSDTIKFPSTMGGGTVSDFANNRKMKMYTNPNQLNSTFTKGTSLANICEAMPDYSILEYYIYSSEEYPPEIEDFKINGNIAKTIRIERLSNLRTNITVINNDGDLTYGSNIYVTHYRADYTNKLYPWKKLVNKDELFAQLLYKDPNIEITSSGVKFTTAKNMTDYHLIMVRLRTGWNYSGCWFIYKSDFGRNNSYQIIHDDGGIDVAYTQGITDNTITISSIKGSHGLYLVGIYGIIAI